MGKVYPDIETLSSKSQPPTEGEMALIRAFKEYLPDDCEIFFQPYLNGDRPDIVILRKGYRAHIVEVKDWCLDHYTIEPDGQWLLKKNGAKLKSPLCQVQQYKDNLYNLHVEGLLEKKIKDSGSYGMVTCSVYFHHETTGKVLRTIKANDTHSSKDHAMVNKYTLLYGHELLNKEGILRFIHQSKLDQFSPYLTDNMHNSMRRVLNPPFHYLEEGLEIRYTPQQMRLTESRPGARQKIKGVAGSGKTLVLAKRAVNAFKRTGSTVLILTFNITLINYIQDLINNVREAFPWNAFEIINYHLFFNSSADRHNLIYSDLNVYNDTSFFYRADGALNKYQTILIDEAQDFQEPWHRIIQNNFLAEGGELVVFADEKQNIYNNELDSDKKVKVPGIPGIWNESMNRPFRYTGRLVSFIKAFQQYALKAKYALDEFQVPVQEEADIGDSNIQYVYWESDTSVPAIVDTIQRYLQENNIHPSDTTILNSRIALIREIDYCIRQTGEKTTTTFETKEIYDLLSSKTPSKLIVIAELEKIRRNKKRHFWMKSGTMKLSTIHSFKGWEIHTAIVIIESEEDMSEFESAELIYTGLTRARVNLLIINTGNAKYNQILQQVI
ncbi:MAG TPA: UvrD-helicase domain-containing protein [Candidatus Cloacimonadota bacterium]|nr:UvrD-helicase domain-containing protein [Candidatus Cloacimonadota bacterium]